MPLLTDRPPRDFAATADEMRRVVEWMHQFPTLTVDEVRRELGLDAPACDDTPGDDR